MITLDNVSKTYATADGALHAVDSVSLQIRPGEIFGIVGFSGAGKSTLLRMINLLERPDSGNVIVGGQNLITLNRRALNLARHDIGMIFQHFHLLSNRNVAENVMLPLEIAGTPKAKRAARVRECLAITNISEKAAAYPAKLSGGQKQRVAIARALANAPKILLCDEPTSSLDPHTTDAILETLRDINRRFGTTIVIVTHEMHVVSQFCQRVAVMENGRLAEIFALNDPQHHPISNIGKLLQQTPPPAASLRIAV